MAAKASVLRVLAVSDSADAADRWLAALGRGGYKIEPRRVADKAALVAALTTESWDVVLGGDAVPGLSVPDVLQACRDASGEVPLVVVASGDGDDAAHLAHIEAGARDVVPESLLPRLHLTVAREMVEPERRRAKQAIEEARRAETRWAHLVQNALYGIYRADVKGRFLLANPALVSMLGYASLPDLLGVTSGENVFRDPKDLDHLVERARDGERIEGLEVEWVRRDGSPLTVRLSGRAVRGEAGVLSGFEFLAEDVTERRSLELQFQRAQKMEAVGRLAGGIAHDFNNVLVAILGYADMLLPTLAAEDPRRRSVEQIQKAGERAASLTRQLLSFSRRQVIDRRVLAVNEVLLEMEPMLRRVLGETVRLESRLDPRLARTRADRGQLEQVVMNLVVNARDASARGGAITLTTRNAAVPSEAGRSRPGGPLPPGPYVVLAVADTGTGMTDEVLAHIFEPFFTTKEEGKGTGLGLSTVYGIVRNAGGTVSVASRPGVGSTFEVWLPATEDAAEGRASDAAGGPSTGHGETILLVEDEPAVRDLTRLLLEGAGYRVLAAADGAEALRRLAAADGAIRLLVTDLVLPDISGVELAQRVRVAAPGMRVLLTSGYTAHSVDVATLEGLRAGFLQKPFRMDSLLNAVRKALAVGEPQIA